jgi:hypothetical protein
MGFWTLFIVRNSKNQNTQRFGNWIFFCPQVRGERHSVGSLRKSYSQSLDNSYDITAAIQTPDTMNATIKYAVKYFWKFIPRSWFAG